jgi:hypothetical protein
MVDRFRLMSPTNNQKRFDSLIAPLARARFVVTLPPKPSQIAHQLQRMASASFTTLAETQDAFLHLARRAQERLVIMTPYIDAAGARWAADLFEATNAPAKNSQNGKSPLPGGQARRNKLLVSWGPLVIAAPLAGSLLDLRYPCLLQAAFPPFVRSRCLSSAGRASRPGARRA